MVSMPTLSFASLTPREFMETPKSFGRVDEPVWVTPPKGADNFCYDQLLAARHQHEWSLAFRRYATHDYGSVSELARHHGIYYPGFARILRGTAHLTLRHLGVMARHAARNRPESSTKVAELAPRAVSGLHRPRWFAQDPEDFGRSAKISWNTTPGDVDAKWRELKDAAVLQHHLTLQIRTLASSRGWGAATLAEVTDTELDTTRNYLFGSRTVGMRWIARVERHLGPEIWEASYIGGTPPQDLPVLPATD